MVRVHIFDRLLGDWTVKQWVKQYLLGVYKSMYIAALAFLISFASTWGVLCGLVTFARWG